MIIKNKGKQLLNEIKLNENTGKIVETQLQSLLYLNKNSTSLASLIIESLNGSLFALAGSRTKKISPPDTTCAATPVKNKKQTKRVDIPSRPLFVIEVTAVLGGTPPPDRTVLLGTLLEHGARLGHNGGLLWRRRRDDGAWIALDCVLGFGVVRLGDERRQRLNGGLVGH